MLAYNDLRAGVTFVLEGQPYEVLEFNFLRMQQRKPVAQTKIKNLFTGKIVTRNFHMNESFEEAEIEKETVKFLYANRPASTRTASPRLRGGAGRQGEADNEYWFSAKDNPAARFKLTAETLGDAAKFLKGNTEVIAFKWNEKLINISPPIKVDLKVTEAPPGLRGDTAQGGTKPATLETGAIISVPLFVNVGDIVRVNTETGTYVERVEKGAA